MTSSGGPAERVGPYRLLERLGAGGMGEVFLAQDERLDRQVALKRIRALGGVSAEKRERFRREARLAARLNHPAIVQIYDVLTEGADEILVLEYVAGTTLRHLVNAGPLAPGRAAAIGRDVAQGLSEAHRHGIVHRDLKSENVLVTPDGRAKIADFGIAKRPLEGEDLTATGLVMGTSRSMAPEQARGEPADFRSDLFSLGVLLYEALAGRSPFSGENQLATLQKVLNATPDPLAVAAPACPSGLAEVVESLLEKDPLHRPRSAAEVASRLASWAEPSTRESQAPTLVEPALATASWAEPPTLASRAPAAEAGLAATPGSAAPEAAGSRRARRRGALAAGLAVALAALGVAAYRALRPPPSPLEVAVLAPRVAGASEAGDNALLSTGVRVAQIQALSALAGVAVKSPDEVDAAAGPPGGVVAPRAVARALAAGEVVATRLDCRAATCQVTLQRVRGQDGNLAAAASFAVPADDPLLAARAVAAHLRAAYAEREARAGAGDLDVASGDFAAYLRARARFEARGDADLAPVLADLAAIRARSPRFLEAHLLESEVARFRYAASRDPRDLERAETSARAARDLAPGDPRPLVAAFSAAYDGGRLDEAERTLADLARFSPGDPQVLDRRALLASARGRPEEALRILRAAVASHPSTKMLRSLAWLEVQQGETAAACGHLTTLLARAPHNADGTSLLAQVELSAGDPARAAALYAELVRKAPRFAQLNNLGTAQFLLGRYAEAAATFARAAEIEPGNPFARLGLADSRQLLGRKDSAAEDYRAVVERIDRDPAAKSDPQLLTVRAQALAHLGRGAEAVRAVEAAVRLAPKNQEVAYESSLVYALLGEKLSALTNAQRAVALGCAPRWFSFPWFDGLRGDPEFRKLAAQPASS